MLSLENNIKASTEEREAKAAVKAEREEAAAAARGDLADTTAARDEDTECAAGRAELGRGSIDTCIPSGHLSSQSSAQTKFWSWEMNCLTSGG